MTDRKKHKVDPSRVKVGDLMAFTYYAKVEYVLGDTKLVVSDLDRGIKTITIEGKELIENSISADFFAEEEKITKTKAEEILASSYGKLFTVCYDKKDGAERVLRGRLVGPAPMGRSMVEDLEQTKDRMRLVDNRTIKWLVLDGVKYTVKG